MATLCLDPGCQDDDGAPRLAAPGLYLCWPHVDHLADNARTAADVWGELATKLVPAGGGLGPVVSGTRDRGLQLDPRAVECRTEIRHVLVGWVKLIAERRGHALPRPPSSIESLAVYVATNAPWLAAQGDIAGEVSQELRWLAYGRARALAYPDGARRRHFGPCPMDGCPGEVWAYLPASGAVRPADARCSVDRLHRWEPYQWVDLHAAISYRATGVTPA